jgi:23S rRNA pseudouridine1911/1915/1917 synthase
LSVSQPCVKYHILPEEQGQRLDHYLVRHCPEQSRSSLGKHIRSGCILVNGQVVKPGCRLHSADIISLTLPPPLVSRLTGQDIAFDVLFEDRDFLVINKPAGLVVHPAAGHMDKTLVNGLLYRYQEMAELEGERPGIVHRLDKDTSGIMLVARTESMHRLLAAAFKERKINKTYLALLVRTPDRPAGRIVAAIGRHPVNRKKMAIRQNSGRYAVSNWQIQETFSNGCCFAQIVIETGRTHQIRVHMASLAAAVAGDTLYGGRTGNCAVLGINRQMLHASTLSFLHPLTGEPCAFTAPLCPDMKQALTRLRTDYSSLD